MNNKQAVILVLVIVVLLGICIAVTPMLMDAIRTIHVIPAH